jgi:hypothetical protein
MQRRKGVSPQWRGLGLACAALAAGCGADPAPGPVARFDLSTDGVPAWGDVPFPSDLYRDSEGAIALASLPHGAPQGPRDVQTLALLGARDGFCASCNVYFRIDGDLWPASVPASADPRLRASPGLAVVLADVDPGSPERGRFFPLRVQWDPVAGLLAVRPVRGQVLHAGRRYAAAITDGFHDMNGHPLRPSADFRALRDGGGDARAASLIGPALDVLAEGGVDRHRIVAAAVFTTEDVTAPLRSVRQAVWSGAPPVATVDQVWTGVDLDELLGVPAEDRPGVDVPNDEGTDGDRAVIHATTAVVVSGAFESPRFVDGTGTEVGALRLGPNGLPEPGPPDRVPFVLIVPAGADLTALPVVVHHHGFNASRTTGFVLADTAGAAGVAVLAIDGYQHGERAESAVDQVHNMRGSAGPDGFAETNMLDVSGRMFGMFGVPDDMRLFGGYPLGGFLQLAADAMGAVRLCAEGGLTAIQDADPALASLAFDPARIFYSGNSMGAVVGASVVTVEPTVVGAVLNVQPGSIVEALVESPVFRPLSQGLFLPLLRITGSFDEIDRHLIFDPTVDMMRWALEPIDPLALAPHLLHNPVVAGPRPDVLVQVASLDEVAGVAPTESFIVAAGIPGHGSEYSFAAVASVELPATGNVTTPAGTSTAVAVQFAPAQHGMLEVLEQVSEFEPPILPPFVPRSSPLTVLNPIEAIHLQIQTFLITRLTGSHATIE